MSAWEIALFAFGWLLIGFAVGIPAGRHLRRLEERTQEAERLTRIMVGIVDELEEMREEKRS